MAQKKAAGSTKNGRDSPGKRLGIKKFGSEYVNIGNILVRQRGTKIKAGLNVKCGRDHTLYAIKSGIVFFKKIKNKTVINVIENKININ